MQASWRGQAQDSLQHVCARAIGTLDRDPPVSFLINEPIHPVLNSLFIRLASLLGHLTVASPDIL
jgi:hypothetical protein